MLAPGGLLSLLVRNADALAVRPGLAGDWAGALAAFDTDAYTNRLGLPVRADRLAALTRTLDGIAAPLHTWYGVRVFTDSVPNETPLPPGGRAGAGCSPPRTAPGAPTPTARWRRCCTSSAYGTEACGTEARAPRRAGPRRTALRRTDSELRGYPARGPGIRRVGPGPGPRYLIGCTDRPSNRTKGILLPWMHLFAPAGCAVRPGR